MACGYPAAPPTAAAADIDDALGMELADQCLLEMSRR